jgi:hypothetical protein
MSGLDSRKLAVRVGDTDLPATHFETARFNRSRTSPYF